MVAPLLRPDGDINPEEQRAAIAAITGPLRSPFGSSRSVTFPAFAFDRPSVLVSRNGTGRPLYVEIRQIAGGAVDLFIGPTENLQSNQASSFSTILNVAIPFVLPPGEGLWVWEAKLAIAFTLLVTEVSP